MKRAEKIILLLVFISIILRVLLIHGSSLMVDLSLMCLSIVYMYLGFALFNNIRLRAIFKKDSYNGITAAHIIGAVGTGLTLSLACIAILFKFLSFPGADIQLVMATILCIVILIISLIKTTGLHPQYYKRIAVRMAIFGSICLLLLIIPQETFTRVMERDNPAYLKAVEKARQYPNNKSLWDTANAEARKMNQH